MKPYAAEQPKDGDTVLTCGHHDCHGHFWKGEGMQASGPEGVVQVKWLVACQACAMRAGFEPRNIAWNECATWKGDEPIIVKETQN